MASGTLDEALRQGREQAALDIEAEARAYQEQFGVNGPGGLTSGALFMAAKIARDGRSD